MATTQLTYTNLVANGGVQEPAGTTLVAAPTNDMQLKGAEPERTVLRVYNNDDDTDLEITVKAGDYPPAWAAGQGDLKVTVAYGEVQYIGPFESGRFLQSDGSMMIESDEATGTITAFLLPKAT